MFAWRWTTAFDFVSIPLFYLRYFPFNKLSQQSVIVHTWGRLLDWTWRCNLQLVELSQGHSLSKSAVPNFHQLYHWTSCNRRQTLTVGGGILLLCARLIRRPFMIFIFNITHGALGLEMFNLGRGASRLVAECPLTKSVRCGGKRTVGWNGVLRHIHHGPRVHLLLRDIYRN